MEKWKDFKKTLLLTVKIAFGSSVAIYLAQALQLEYAASAGTIALLTLMATKWETLRLFASRVATFAMSVLIAWAAFACVNSTWIAYGIFVFILVLLCEMMGWSGSISINSVIGAHLLTSHDFTAASIWNEFLLVIIGVSIALILNLFYDNRHREKDIIADMRHTEKKLQTILYELAAFLSNQEMPEDVWNDICCLGQELRGFLKEAYEFQENTFRSHPAYYIDYFQMRQNQCRMLQNLNQEMEKIRNLPKQAEMIADYMLYLANYVLEKNEPDKQIEKLNSLFEDIRKSELPKTREEFEERALLYHVLMDLQEFLSYKSKFVRGLDGAQLERYWR